MTNRTITEPERLTLDGDVRHLEVWFAHGRLNVVGADGPPRVEITKVGRKGVTVRHENGVLTVRHEKLRRWPEWTGPLWWFLRGRRAYQADVSIAVPRAASGDLTVISGNVVASGLRGGTKADVTSGRITLLGVEGRVRANAVSGSIEALGVGAGGDLTVDTVSGEIILADSSAERVSARAISGSITCDLDNPEATDVRLDTTSGQITVRVPEDADLSVNLSCTSGRITSAFPHVRPSGAPGLRSAVGKLGAGTGNLYARAVSGSISLLARPAADGFKED